MNVDKRIIKAINGNRKAIDLLLLENRGIVTAAIGRHIEDKEKQKDIIQSTFYKAIDNIKNFKMKCRFSTWLYRIATNETIEHLRKNNRKDMIFSQSEEGMDIFKDINSPDALANLSNKQLKGDLEVSLQSLSLEQKTIFSLFYFGNYKGKDIAEVLNITENNVFVKLKTAREKIKKELIIKGWSL